MQPILFVDLDGVLVDLLGGLGDIIGQDLKKLSKDEFDKVYYKFIEDQSHEQLVRFWSNLPPMSNYKLLWDHVTKYQPLILTAAGNSIATCIGKKKWCEKHLKIKGDRVFCSKNSSEKQYYASSKSILIDDFDRNVKQFKEKGGHAILHTAPKKTLLELKKIFKKMNFTQK